MKVIKKRMLFHFKLLRAFIALSMKCMNFLNCITWFNPACSGAAHRPKIKFLFFLLFIFLPFSSSSFRHLTHRPARVLENLNASFTQQAIPKLPKSKVIVQSLSPVVGLVSHNATCLNGTSSLICVSSLLVYT